MMRLFAINRRTHRNFRGKTSGSPDPRKICPLIEPNCRLSAYKDFIGRFIHVVGDEHISLSRSRLGLSVCLIEDIEAAGLAAKESRRLM